MEQAAAPLAFAGLIIILLGLAVWLVRNKIDWVTYVVLAIGVLCVVTGLAARPETVRRFLTSRQMALGANSLVMTIAFLAILVSANYWSYRHHARKDVTKSGIHTLSPQTKKVLQNINKQNKKRKKAERIKIDVMAFYKSTGAGGRDFERMKKLFEEYRYICPDIHTRVIDPNLKPDLAKEYGITSYSTVVIKCGDKKENVSFGDEQDFTAAILKVTRDTKKKVYFLKGHGEKDPQSYGDDSMGDAKSALEKLHYEVATANLLRESPEVPDDCAVLVIAGPKSDLLESEEEAIAAYVEDGGSLLAMVDPVVGEMHGSSVESLLSRWDIHPQEGFIVDPMSQLFTGAGAPVVNKFEYHETTKQLSASCYFPLARALKYEGATDPQSPIKETDLAKSSADAWVETGGGTEQVSRDPGEQTGPLTMALVVTTGNKPSPPPGQPAPPDDDKDKGPKARIIVIGDSDFATNNHYNRLGNGNFFENCVNWLAEEEDLISIKAKQPDKNTVTLTGSQTKLVALLSMVLMPLLCLSTGIAVWWVRR